MALTTEEYSKRALRILGEAQASERRARETEALMKKKDARDPALPAMSIALIEHRAEHAAYLNAWTIMTEDLPHD